MDNENSSTRGKIGIKHPKFTADGENGQSHRKNKLRKKAQYLRNVNTRAALYRLYQGDNRRDAREFHLTLEALSMGTA